MDQISCHSSPLEREPVLPTPPLPPSIPLDDSDRENSPPDNQAFDDFDEGDGSWYNSDEESPPLPDNLPPVTDEPIVLPDIIQSLEFIQMLEDATLESQLSSEDLDTLRNPQAHSSTPSDDPDLLLSISCFIDLLNSSQEAYEKICDNIRKQDPTIEMLSYDRVRRTVQKLSGIIALEDHMCFKSCTAFTGPFAHQ